MKELSVEEVRAHDKRSVALHEAGHVVVAATLGHTVRAWLTEQHDAEDYTTENLWTGQPRSNSHIRFF